MIDWNEFHMKVPKSAMSLKGVARLLRGVNREDRPVLRVRPVAVRLVTDRNVATDRRPLLCGVATGVTYNGMSESSNLQHHAERCGISGRNLCECKPVQT